jgi:PIN domain nuclease of toxin-antitoxin system
LLDTNAALTALTNPKDLSPRARKAILAGPNFLSVIVYWEVLLKSMKGSLDVGDPRSWWLETLEELAAMPVILRPDHVAAVYGLPLIHKDPFDRMLIAQASVEGWTLLTTDETIPLYASERFRYL